MLTNSLPPNWSWVKLGDVVERMSNGCSAAQYQHKGDYPITRIETISFSEVDLNRVRYVKDISNEDVEKYQLFYNDILFSHINSDIHLGKTALFKLKDKVVIHGINLLLIRANERVHSNFLNYLFNFYRIKGEFLKIAQHAVNQSSINQKKLKNVDIPLPPLREQKKIVEKIEELFSGLDSGVASLKNAKTQIRLYRQSVLASAFSGRLHQDSSDYLINKIKGKNKSSKSFNPENPQILVNHGSDNLPDGWKWVKLGEFVSQISGCAFKSDAFTNRGVLAIKISNIGYSEFVLKNQEYLPENFLKEYSNYIIYPDDLLIALTRPITNNTTKVCFYPNNLKPALLNQRVAVLKSIDTIQKKYIFYYFQTEEFRKFLKSKFNETLQPNLSPKDLINTSIPFSNKEEQTQIIEEIEKRFSEADNLEKAIDESLVKSETLRQSILKQAFEGRLI